MSLTPEAVIEATLKRLNARPRYISNQKLETISAEKLKNFGGYSYIPALFVYRDMCLHFLSQTPNGEEVMQQFAGDPAPQEAAARAARKIKLDKNYQAVYTQLSLDLGLAPALLPKPAAPLPESNQGTTVTFSIPASAPKKPAAVAPSNTFNKVPEPAPYVYELNIHRVIDATLKEYNKSYRPRVDLDRIDIQTDSVAPDALFARDVITYAIDRLHQQRDSDLRYDIIKLYLNYKNDQLIDAAKLRAFETIIEKDERARSLLMAVARAADLDMNQSIAFIQGKDVPLFKKSANAVAEFKL